MDESVTVRADAGAPEAPKRAEKLPTTDRGWQAWLQNVKPPAGRRWQALRHSLEVCLEPNGSKTFQARLRRAGDANARRITIGHFPAVSVAEARQRLAEARAEAKEGRDPALARRRARAGVDEIHTFGQLVDWYLEKRAEGLAFRSKKMKPKSLLIETQALVSLRKALGDRLLSDIEPRDFGAVVEREATRLRKEGRTGRTANIALATAKRIYKAAQGAGVYVGPSPVANLTRPAAEVPRERALFDGVVILDPGDAGKNETGRLVAELRRPGKEPATRAAIMLTLMLGLRAGEAAALEWRAVRLDDAPPTLSILSGKTASAARVVPLPAQAVALLRELKRDGREKYVFAARDDAKRAAHLHPQSLYRAYKRLCAGLKIDDTTLHDLRRTTYTGVIELTGDESLAKRTAGHKPKEVARHYDRSKRLNHMLTAVTLWADAIDAAVARHEEGASK